MEVDPHSFTVIVQSQDDDGSAATCWGFPQVAAAEPTRLLLIAEPARAAWRDSLLQEVIGQVDATGQGRRSCPGPSGLGCFSVAEPGVRHLLVVVAGNAGPSADLERFVDDWLARGWEALGVFRDGFNPDDVLPTALRTQHAPSWQVDVREVAAEITDALILGAEDRRVFISYSHADGSAIATRLADILGHLRFDVFLDRFRLAPGVDFIERINDELVDKAMVVVVETPASVASSWVRHEVATAVTKRLGLAAVNLGFGPMIGEIGELARCRIDDDDRIGAFVLAQHRVQLWQRKESLMQSVWHSLARAGAGAAARPTANGFLVRTPARSYALTVRPRPADLHRFRVAHERAAGADTVVVHPRPVRSDRRRDIAWLTTTKDLIDVDEAMIDTAAADIVAGTL